MTAVFAFLAILLATLTGHAPAVPAAAALPLPHHDTQVGQSTSPHRAPARAGAPVVIRGDVPAPAPVAHPATVVPAPVLDPEHPDYQPQQPEEIIGRQIDCPDGSVGTVVNAAGDVHCPS